MVDSDENPSNADDENPNATEEPPAVVASHPRVVIAPIRVCSVVQLLVADVADLSAGERKRKTRRRCA